MTAPGALESGVTYYWRVDTIFGDVRSQGAVYDFTLESALAFPVPALSAGSEASITDTSLPVSWTDSSEATGFELQYRKKGVLSWSIVSTEIWPDQTHATLSGLLSGTEYEIRIRATNASGNSDWSSILVMMTKASLAPLIITSPPTSLIAVIGSGTESPLTVTVNKSEVTYQWFKDSVVVPDATQSTYLPSYIQPQHSGYYYCQISDGVNIVETEPVVLGVIEKTASPNPLLVAVGGI